MAPPIIGKVEFKTDGGKIVMTFDPDYRRLNLLEEGEVIAFFDAKEGMLPNFYITKGAGADFEVIHRLKNNGEVSFGASNANGSVSILGSDGRQKFRLDANSGDCQIGGYGVGGHLMLLDSTAKNPDSAPKATIHLRANDATVRVGGSGKDGELRLFAKSAKNWNTDTEATIRLDAADATVRVGGSGKDGSLLVRNAKDKTVIQIDGKSGDILLENADCAEDFDVDDPSLEAGSVLVLGDEPGRLRVSEAPYDTRVAGILSGAGDYRPAIVLDRKPGREGRRPVALVGKAWCKVEAGSAPITVGCLLTTSSLPGHAMAVTDRERAFGAVLGKALAPLAAGVGVVPVLVALQ